MHGVWSEEVKQFALVARRTQDINAFGVFRGGFTTTLTADGNALFSAHTLIGGGTETNLGTGVLNNANLEAAVTNLRMQKNQRGIVLGNVPAVLLVPPALFFTAIKITESALVSGNAQNDINVFRSAYGIQVYQSPDLGAAAGGSDTAWFLIANNHAIYRIVRQGIETALSPWQHSTNRTYNYQANYRETVVAIDYVGVYGSTGTVS